MYICCYLYRKHMWCQLCTKQYKSDRKKSLIISSLILSKTRGLETNQERIYKLNQQLRMKVNLTSFLFPVLGYSCPPPTLHLSPLTSHLPCYSFRNICLSAVKKVCKSSELSTISDKNYGKNCYLGNFVFLPPTPS